jgi:hypothetical protein
LRGGEERKNFIGKYFEEGDRKNGGWIQKPGSRENEPV